jgi:hypothetical protein
VVAPRALIPESAISTHGIGWHIAILLLAADGLTGITAAAYPRGAD